MVDGLDDDVARRFRENDSLGDSSSFWYRATRQLFEEHKPIGKMTLLTSGPTRDEQLPLGLFTYTAKNRLIYWPALGTWKGMEIAGKKINIFDHITLELPSEKIHLTYFHDSGKKNRLSDAARTFRYPGTDLSICFQILVKIDVLRAQETEIQRKVHVPRSHQSRMVEWLSEFSRSLTHAPTMLTPYYANCDYVHYAILLDPQSISEEKLPSADDILTSDGRQNFVDGWDAAGEYQVHFSRFNVESCKILFAAACPPGKLRHPVAFQIARRRLRKGNGPR